MKERKEKANINKTKRDNAKLERKKKKHRKTIVVKVTVALLLS